MRRIVFLSTVISSWLIAAAALAATHPHYGGVLHVQMTAAISTLDPADRSHADSLADHNVNALLFDTLLVLDNRGQLQPALAISWQPDSTNQVWQLIVHPGVRFSDETPMTPELVAASLRRANPRWRINSNDTSVTIQLEAPSVNLPAELSLSRNSIVKLDSGKTVGTGPFVVSRWDPGRKLTLAARDDYWAGRPFLDSVEIEMGKGFRDEAIAYDTGRAQVIEVPPDQMHHAADARQLHVSEPTELVALVFSHDAQTPEESKQRQALALSIDRPMLNRVVLQGGGASFAGLLPDWLTGYGFLFPANADLTRAQQLRAEVPQASLWTVGFDANDPLARMLAERIALNAADAGLRLQVTNQNNPDIRLLRLPLASVDPHIALAELTKSLGIPPPKILGNSADDLYHAENAILQTQRVIPLLHLRIAWAVSKAVGDWEDDKGGTWRLPSAWLAAGKP